MLQAHFEKRGARRGAGPLMAQYRVANGAGPTLRSRLNATVWREAWQEAMVDLRPWAHRHLTDPLARWGGALAGSWQRGSVILAAGASRGKFRLADARRSLRQVPLRRGAMAGGVALVIAGAAGIGAHLLTPSEVGSAKPVAVAALGGMAQVSALEPEPLRPHEKPADRVPAGPPPVPALSWPAPLDTGWDPLFSQSPMLPPVRAAAAEGAVDVDDTASVAPQAKEAGAAAPADCMSDEMRKVIADVESRFGPVTLVSTTRLNTDNHDADGAWARLHARCQAVDIKTGRAPRRVVAYLRKHDKVNRANAFRNGVIHIDFAPTRSAGRRGRGA